VSKQRTPEAMGPFADWKDNTQYPDPATTEIEQWIWQFLRRNPKYQADWQRERAVYPKYKDESRLIPTMFQQTIKPDTAIFTVHTRHGREHYLDHYGLQYLINPTIATPETFFLKFDFLPGRVVSLGPYGDFDETLPDHYVLIVVDLDYPLDPQLKIAKLTFRQNELARELVFAKKPKGKQNRPDLWRRYLRVLDANQEGIAFDDIAPVLFPGHENQYPEFQGRVAVRDSLEAALAIRDSKFQFMLLQAGAKYLNDRIKKVLSIRRENYKRRPP
jgi:hypothetical protein